MTNLAVVEEHVKSEDADFHLDVFDFDVFSFPSHELLEWQDFLFYHVPSYGFTIKDKAFRFRLDPGLKLS